MELEIERKTQKKIEGRNQDRENDEKIIDIDIYLYRFVGCNSDVVFFVNEEEKCKEKQLHFVVNCKVSQNPRKNIDIFFLMNEQIFWN